ncbi:hypothetical protein NL676_015805 [Syzygium grande]|nr:hypothetical protein NL676_015805 [Syzygium grande]
MQHDDRDRRSPTANGDAAAACVCVYDTVEMKNKYGGAVVVVLLFPGCFLSLSCLAEEFLPFAFGGHLASKPLFEVLSLLRRIGNFHFRNGVTEFCHSVADGGKEEARPWSYLVRGYFRGLLS